MSSTGHESREIGASVRATTTAQRHPQARRVDRVAKEDERRPGNPEYKHALFGRERRLLASMGPGDGGYGGIRTRWGWGSAWRSPPRVAGRALMALKNAKLHAIFPRDVEDPGAFASAVQHGAASA